MSALKATNPRTTAYQFHIVATLAATGQQVIVGGLAQRTDSGDTFTNVVLDFGGLINLPVPNSQVQVEQLGVIMPLVEKQRDVSGN